MVLHAKGDLDEALKYFQIALSIKEEILDANSPDLADTYSKIGLLLQAKGDLEEALKYYQNGIVYL